MNPFAYPDQPHRRRHGPRGYAGYESYRGWLRDEFSFRCVYCLNREQWVIAKGAFAIDHFVATSINPDLIVDYDNLLYACVACNLTRGNQAIPDPLSTRPWLVIKSAGGAGGARSAQRGRRRP